ncbi:MAG: Sec-independent protein translocase protein TatB [Acidimicrobiales bacterium]
MFNVGSGELLVLLVLALIVLGPDKLPETIRKVSGFLGDLRRMSQSFQDEMRQAVDLSDLQREFTGNPGPSLPPLPESEQPAAAPSAADPEPPEQVQS